MENLIQLIRESEWREVPEYPGYYLNKKAQLIHATETGIRLFEEHGCSIYMIHKSGKRIGNWRPNLLRLLYTYEERDKSLQSLVENIEGEEWRDVIGYEQEYRVSNKGRLLSKEKIVRTAGGKETVRQEQLMTLFTDKNGYLTVSLRRNRQSRYTGVHRIVAKTFLNKPIGKNQINHKNGIKDDNRVENLEWVTPQENTKHAYEIGLIKKGEGNPKARLTEKDVIAIRSSYTGEKGQVTQLSKEYSVSRTTIDGVVKRRFWTHI